MVVFGRGCGDHCVHYIMRVKEGGGWIVHGDVVFVYSNALQI